MSIKFLLGFIAVVLCTGCPLTDDCEPEDNNYSHTEYDCYYKDYSVEVCGRNGCTNETRSKHVCEDVHVCYSDNEWE